MFCDVDAETRNVTVETVRGGDDAAHTAIVAVDLFGLPAPVHRAASAGLPVLEDAAQAAGARSPAPRRARSATRPRSPSTPPRTSARFGDGGAIATDDDAVAELARALRFHGSRDKQTFDYVGYNSRLDAIQAAILRVLLPPAGRLVRRPPGAAPSLPGRGRGPST